jgi:hypothetical protein
MAGIFSVLHPCDFLYVYLRQSRYWRLSSRRDDAKAVRPNTNTGSALWPITLRPLSYFKHTLENRFTRRLVIPAFYNVYQELLVSCLKDMSTLAVPSNSLLFYYSICRLVARWILDFSVVPTILPLTKHLFTIYVCRLSRDAT